MKVNLSKQRIVLLLFLLSYSLIFSLTLDEAQRNYNMGLYQLSQAQFKTLLNEDSYNEACWIGLLSSLSAQQKFSELVSEFSNIPRSIDNYLIDRIHAYALFMQKDYSQSLYYYHKALKDSDSKDIEYSGIAWSKYYKGDIRNAMLYTDLISSDYLDSTPLDEELFFKNNYLYNYIELFYQASSKSQTVNSAYFIDFVNASIALNYNRYNDDEISRDYYNIDLAYYIADTSFEIAFGYLDGDYDKLYDSYLASSKITSTLQHREFSSILSLLASYSYWESLSVSQVTLGYSPVFSKLQLSSSINYQYLDYITPNFDKHELSAKFKVNYQVTDYINLMYSLSYGKSNFLVDENMLVYDDFDIENNQHTVGIDISYNKSKIYLRYKITDLEDTCYGSGVSYAF